MFRVFLTFYRTFFLFTGSISLVSGVFLWNSKNISSIIMLFWMKIITNVLIAILFNTFKSEGFYFYNNLGFSARQMFLGVLVLDLTLWGLFNVLILVG